METIGQAGQWWARVAGATALTTAIFGTAHAVDLSFNVASGDWDVTSNWSGNALPGAGDNAILAPTQNFTPIATKTGGTIASNIQLVGASKLQLAGNVSLTGDLIDGGTFGSEIRMASGATLSIDSGTLLSGNIAFLGNLFASAGSNPRTINNRGTIGLSGVSFIQPSVLNNEVGGIIEVAAGANATMSLDALSNAGTLRVTGLNSLLNVNPFSVFPATFTSSGTVTVADNAVLHLERFGTGNASDYTFRNTGQFNVTTDGTVRVTSGTITGTSAFNFDDATLQLNNRGTVSNATLNLTNDSRLRFSSATATVQNSTISSNRFTLNVDSGVTATATGNTIRNATGTALTILRDGSGTINLANSTITATGAGSLFTLQNAGQVNLTGNTSLTAGTVTLNNGDLGLQDTARIVNATAINVNNGSSLSINGAGVNIGTGTLNANGNSLVSLTNHTFTNNRTYNFNASTLALNTGGIVNGAILNLNNGSTVRFDTTGTNITGATLTGDRFTVAASSGRTGTIQNSTLQSTGTDRAITFAGPGSLRLIGNTSVSTTSLSLNAANVTLANTASLRSASNLDGHNVFTNSTLTLTDQSRVEFLRMHFSGSDLRIAGNQVALIKNFGGTGITGSTTNANNLFLSGNTAGGTTFTLDIGLGGKWDQIGASYDGGTNARTLHVDRNGVIGNSIDNHTLIVNPSAFSNNGQLFAAGTRANMKIVPTNGGTIENTFTMLGRGFQTFLTVGDNAIPRVTFNNRSSVRADGRGSVRFVNTTVNNVDDFTFDEGGLDLQNSTFNNSPTEGNRFRATNNSQISVFNSSLRGTGTYALESGSALFLDTSTVDGATINTGSGNILVTGGETRINAGGTLTGNGFVVVGGGATLNVFAGGAHAQLSTSLISLDATSKLKLGAAGLGNSAIVTAGSVTADNATIRMEHVGNNATALRSNNITLRNGARLEIAGTQNSIGATTGNSTVTFAGTSASTVFLDGDNRNTSLTIPSTMTMTGRIGRIGGEATGTVGQTRLTNAGRITSNISGNKTTIDPAIFTNSGVLEAISGADIDINTATRPTNTGTITVGGNSTLSLFDGLIQTAGSTTVAPLGRILISKGQTFELRGGQLNGRGRVSGNVLNTGGTISPGSSPGLLEIEGDYVQSGDGILYIELGGDNPSLFDQLQVFGNVTLGGTLFVTALDGYVPSMGQTFDCITGDTITGSFSRIISYVPGLAFQGQVNNNIWQMTTVVAVPEISTLWLILTTTGTTGIVLLRRHGRKF